jgi:mersacidin/lichenicidin family type 2 lantibiotic
MNKTDVIRAWKDPIYRAGLSGEQLAALPNHPSSLIELREEDLRAAGGYPVTTFVTCTQFTLNNRTACCPK